jgi:hypothetical protein
MNLQREIAQQEVHLISHKVYSKEQRQQNGYPDSNEFWLRKS